MDSFGAMMRGQSAAARGAKKRVFDWNKAAKMILAVKPNVAIAGLSSDMSCTAGTIYKDGKPLTKSGAYLSSNWATPVIVMDDGNELPCWVYADWTDGWNANTLWPQSALDILNGKVSEHCGEPGCLMFHMEQTCECACAKCKDEEKKP
jgi:hypothetical protein